MLRTIKNVWKWKKNEIKHAEKKKQKQKNPIKRAI